MADARDPRRCWGRRLAVATLAVTALAAVVAGIAWQADSSRRGTLVLECPDDSLAVEVYSEGATRGIGDLLSRDQRPEWRFWGAPPPRACTGRCVFFRQSERGRWEIRLAPGTYTVATHRKSPCGFYGGDHYRTIEVGTGEQIVIELPPQ